MPSPIVERRAVTEHKLLTAGKWAGAIAGIFGLVGVVWGGVSRVTALVDSVHDATAAIEQLRVENTRIATEARADLTGVMEAVRARAERDQEIITQLRIAVAALESASTSSAVRHAARHPIVAPPPPTGSRPPLLASPPALGVVHVDDLAEARGALDRARFLSAGADPLENVTF